MESIRNVFTTKSALRIAASAVFACGLQHFALGDSNSIEAVSNQVYLESYSDPDTTLTLSAEYQYSNLSPGSFGNSSDYSSTLYDGYTYQRTDGDSYAGTLGGWSFDTNEEATYVYYTLTNNGSYGEWAALFMNPYSGVYAQGSFVGYGYANSYAAVQDLNQGGYYSVQDEAFSGRDSDSWMDTTWIYAANGGGFNEYTEFDYAPVDAGIGHGAYWVGDWWIYLAPGESDQILASTDAVHEAYSGTPSPAAVLPFGAGLFGVLRRRRGVR